MDAQVYDKWFRYYDLEEKEKKEIDKQLSAIFDEKPGDVWKNKRVLEIGCGTGRFSMKIIDDVRVLYAIDPDKERLEILKNKLNEYPESKKKFYNSTLNDLWIESCRWEEFDVIIFSWSWAYIDELDINYGKARTLDIAMNLLKDNGAIVFSMVTGGEYEEVCDEVSKKSGILTNDLERNRLAMDKLCKLTAWKNSSSILYDVKIKTYFDFLSNRNAIDVIRNDVGGEVDLAVIKDIIGEKTKLTDILRIVTLKKSIHKKITFNYKLCDNRGDCSAMKACQNYSVGAIIREEVDGNLNGQLRILEHLCVECKKCINICELFSLHNTWAEFFEKNRQIEAAEREIKYMDEFRYGSGSGDDTRKITSLKEFTEIIELADETPLILEISEANSHASSYDCPKIKDLIGEEKFDQIYHKFDISSSISEMELCEIREYLKAFGITVFPSLIVTFGKSLIYKYEGYLSLTNDGEYRVRQVRNEIEGVIKNRIGG